VRQADKSYRQALNAREVAVLEKLIADDFLFIRRSGEIWDKKAFLESIKAGKLVSNVQEKDLKTRLYGDTAILTHMDSLKTPDGAVIEMIAYASVREGTRILEVGIRARYSASGTLGAHNGC